MAERQKTRRLAGGGARGQAEVSGVYLHRQVSIVLEMSLWPHLCWESGVTPPQGDLAGMVGSSQALACDGRWVLLKVTPRWERQPGQRAAPREG